MGWLSSFRARLRSRKSSRREASRPARPRRFPPSFEALEERILMNAPPVFDQSSYTFLVQDSAPVGAPVGTVHATATDPSPILYQLVGNPDASHFHIDGSTGNIWVATPLNAQTQNL